MFAMKKRNLIFLIILVFTVGSISGTSLLYFAGEELTGQVLITKSELADLKDLEKTYKDVDLLKQKIEEMSLYNVKEEDLILGMKRGLFDGVGDPYTNYLTKEDYDSLKIMTTGQLQGIGVTVTVKDNHVEIVSTVKESPAHKAGLKSGDAILKIDDIEYDGSQLQEAATALRGNVGTKVKVTFVRNGITKEVTIIRANIELESVTSKVIEGNIGYIDIKSFEINTGKDFEKELRTLEMKGVASLIIDLRDNGGGIVESGVEVADLLIDEGVIAYTEDYKKDRTYYKSVSGKTKLPYVVLVNEGTASTSEILVAGIKYHKAGAIIGTKTYGKGIIQTVAEVSKDDYMRITIMEYFAPDGKRIDKVGITPDYVVNLQENDLKDYQLEKAIELLKKQ
ncbi:MAG: S41 family peptidase [Peptostreptococcaceae bacterium]|nr:S41 family peptidase [Peptostreptococcaceae bacterium]